MGKDLAAAFPEARRVFEEADDVCGFALSKLCFEGPESGLVLTENTQPALLTTSIATLRCIEARGGRFDMVAGHSLGEYSALVAAGALEFGDAVGLVRKRGQFMQRAVPVGVGAMAAVIGLDLAAVEEICRSVAGSQVVSAANQNSPEQVALAGHAEAVQRASDEAIHRGAKRVIPLPVSAPFHCALMKPAEEQLRPFLEKTRFSDLVVPLVNNVDAEVVRSGAEARNGLVRQVCSMVRWTESVRRMNAEGVDEFVEIGPGRVLGGLIRRICSGVKTGSVEKPSQVGDYA